MRFGKLLAARCLLITGELSVIFLTVDLLWELIGGCPPFSFGIYLFAGALTVCANAVFARKRRLLWQVILLNALVCAVWVPLLSLTLDRRSPLLLMLQLPLYIFPLWRGYTWGTHPVTARGARTAVEIMAPYCFFYLIVVSWSSQFANRVPLLLILLLLELLLPVLLRTSGPNTVRAGSISLRHLPSLLLPVLLAVLAAVGCLVLLAFQSQLSAFFSAAGAVLESALLAVVRFLSSLSGGGSASLEDTASSDVAGGSGSLAPLPERGEAWLSPELVTGLLLLAAVGCLVLLAFQSQLSAFFSAAGAVLESALLAVVRFLSSLSGGGSASLEDTASSDVAGGSGSLAPLPERGEAWLSPELVTGLLLLAAGALAAAGLAALIRWFWRNRNRRAFGGSLPEDLETAPASGKAGLLSRLRWRLRRRLFLLRYAGTPRAALLELERWGIRRRCGRQPQETPREYLERLAAGPLRQALGADGLAALYQRLTDEVDRSLYGGLSPRLSREQVRSLLRAIRLDRSSAPRETEAP